MRSPSRIITGLVLAVAVGVSLTQAVSIVADEPLKPIPESHEIGSSQSGANYHNHNGHNHNGVEYVDGMVNYGNCPACRGAMRDNGGWGHCESCNRNRRIAPGTGWCAPGKVPVVRERVQYQKYYPNYWSGYGPGPAQPYKPMVYTPTDTSQLGYYYQHTPTWTAQPWRVPGPPHPAYWHNRYCGRNKNGNQPSCQYTSHYGYVSGTVIDGTEVESEGKQPTLATPPKATPKPKTTTPPQTIRLPEPKAPSQPPVLSVLPDVPPEV